MVRFLEKAVRHIQKERSWGVGIHCLLLDEYGLGGAIVGFRV